MGFSVMIGNGGSGGTLGGSLGEWQGGRWPGRGEGPPLSPHQSDIFGRLPRISW